MAPCQAREHVPSRTPPPPIRHLPWLVSLESFEGWTDIWSHAGLTASFWLYSFLLFRDVFVGGNPLLTAKAGNVLKFKPECLEYSLFCKMEGDVPLDCVPLWPRQVSDSTRRVLKRMGSEPRGHRAHRSGGVSRVCPPPQWEHVVVAANSTPTHCTFKAF